MYRSTKTQWSVCSNPSGRALVWGLWIREWFPSPHGNFWTTKFDNNMTDVFTVILLLFGSWGDHTPQMEEAPSPQDRPERRRLYFQEWSPGWQQTGRHFSTTSKHLKSVWLSLSLWAVSSTRVMLSWHLSWEELRLTWRTDEPPGELHQGHCQPDSVQYVGRWWTVVSTVALLVYLRRSVENERGHSWQEKRREEVRRMSWSRLNLQCKQLCFVLPRILIPQNLIIFIVSSFIELIPMSYLHWKQYSGRNM